MPSKKASTSAAQKMSESTSAPVKPVVEEPVAPAPQVVVTEPVVDTASPLQELSTKIAVATSAIKDVQNSLKALTKEYERMKKLVEKTERKRANARTQPSGFAKPTKISDEMCDFLGVRRGTELSRTDIILPDPKLKKILGVTGDEEVSFFVLQRFIKNHFIKSA